MSSTSRNRFVPLARYSKIHGRSLAPVLKFQNFHTNISSIQKIKNIFYVQESGELLREDPIQILSVKPHGGTWEQAPFLLLEVSSDERWPDTPFCIGVLREDLPPIRLENSEVYLWDLLHKPLFDQEGQAMGRVQQAHQNSAGRCFLESSEGFLFPLEWMDYEASQKINYEKIIVPNLGMWKLNPKETSDEGTT